MSQSSYKPGDDADLPFSDLHCHSRCSDGELSPRDLVRRAAERGVELLAITDHDTVAAIGPAQQEASLLGLELINGTELTCFWDTRVVHILGLGFDHQQPQLLAYLERLVGLRNQRAEIIAQKLIKKGCPDLLQAAVSIAGDGQVGRPHFARALVEAGVVSTENQAFNQYLGAGKAGDVKVSWPTMAEAIGVINDAGGIAVLAHPTKYNLSFTKIRILVERFAQEGGGGIEISYPGADAGHIIQLDKLAQKHGLVISAGSDFHKTACHWTGLGKYPKYKSNSPHILNSLL
ncbi:PHP domain-containing protein [Amphritea sp. HPY]|uniref:PHP domain-containing protein n=1 Tax=Amphritea sp. HPY TaxID=3421652 RepID=UPI003D7F165A